MARPLRIVFSGAFYHVTARGNERKAIFKSRKDREKFLEYLETASERYNAVIHVYCMMDNHYHLLLETPSGNLPQIMRHINGAYTTYFNVKRARTGHLFQGRYKAILVDVDEYAKGLSRYIHLNPVRAKMVDAPEDYAWSSYNYYIGKQKSPSWLNKDLILGYYGSKVAAARKQYQSFVETLVGQTYDTPLTDVVGSVLLGSQGFIDFIKKKYISKQEKNRNLPALNQLKPNVPMDQIFKAVDSLSIKDKKVSRNLKIYLCHKYTGKKLKTIGNHFSISESAVSRASGRALEQIGPDRKLKKKVTILEKNIKNAKM